MKTSRPIRKRRRKDRTWAEAATLALQLSSTKVLGIRTILQTIYDEKLKEISLDKAAENVLTTMLNHHAQLPNCPFFRVKGRYGLYALKDSWLKRNSGGLVDSGGGINFNGLQANKDPLTKENHRFPVEERAHAGGETLNRENHTFAIQGRAMPPETTRKSNKNTTHQGNMRKNNLDYFPFEQHVASVGVTRRNSSPLSSNAGHPPQRQAAPVTRINSCGQRRLSQDQAEDSDQQFDSNLDLETPSSILVNANMKALVNKETFSMLPPSYRYKLTQLLPQCDRVVDQDKEEDKKIFIASQTALNNEFFSQAVQEWRDRLSDGEFTRETQSRIAQEIAKERSKIDPWKEKFFEEFYGQKQITIKRLRSRGLESNHTLQDFGIEAQLAKFADLRKDLQETKFGDSSSTLANIPDDFRSVTHRLKSAQNTINNLRLRTFAVGANKKQYNSYAERIARTKVANSKYTKLKMEYSVNKQTPKVAQIQSASSIVMKPSGAFSALVNHAKQLGGFIANNSNNNCEGKLDGTNTSNPYLDIRKDSLNGAAAIYDHAYTSALWHRPLNTQPAAFIPDSRQVRTNSPQSKSSTLVLCPRGNLVNSTIAIMQSEVQTSEPGRNLATSTTTTTSSLISGFPKKDVTFKIISSSCPGRPGSGSSDTERVLSLCARPLTPESFVTGTSKPSNAFLTTIKQVPSPLSIDSTTTLPSSSGAAATTCPSYSNTVAPKPTTCQPTVAPAPQQAATPVVRNMPFSVTYTPALHTTTPALLHTSTSTIGAVPLSRTHAMPATTVFQTIASQSVVNSMAQVRKPSPATGARPQTTEHTVTLSHMANLHHPVIHSLASQNSTQNLPIVTSPLAPGRLTIAGIKRSRSTSQNTPSPPGAAVKWGSTSSPSPPMKKTRTLAEIKAQMKAKKAAAAAAGTSIRPAVEVQPGAVAANTHSHMFCATTFPVYFPLVTSSPSSIIPPISASQQLPSVASYIRLPNTAATLPLERLQWVNQPPGGTTLVASATKSSSDVSVVTSQSPNLVSTTGASDSAQQTPKSSTVVEEKRPVTKPGRGKITLKIKAAGSAISLKVDAEMIKKERKRESSSTTSDEENQNGSDDETSSAESEESDDSEEEDEVMSSNRAGQGTRHISLSTKQSSESGTDSGNPKTIWSHDSQGGQSLPKSCENRKQSAGSSSLMPSKNPAALLMKQHQNTAVFGVSPYNVNIKSSGSEPTSFPSNSLFKAKTSSISFRDVPSTWSVSMSVGSDAKFSSTQPITTTISTIPQKHSKYKSTSKGKSLQHMQELAKSSMLHSDDSADADSSEDEQGEISTTTASENDKGTESDDSSRSWKPGQPDSPESSLSDENSSSKRPTHFPLKKAVKSRGNKSSPKIVSLSTPK